MRDSGPGNFKTGNEELPFAKLQVGTSVSCCGVGTLAQAPMVAMPLEESPCTVVHLHPKASIHAPPFMRPSPFPFPTGCPSRGTGRVSAARAARVTLADSLGIQSALSTAHPTGHHLTSPAALGDGRRRSTPTAEATPSFLQASLRRAFHIWLAGHPTLF
jgi:hypothetical protein